MVVKYNLTNDWNKLSHYQMERISHILLSHKNGLYKDILLLLVLLREKPTMRSLVKSLYFFAKTKLVDTLPIISFLHKPSERTVFPEIKGLVKPSNRLGNLSVDQFQFFLAFLNENKGNSKDELTRIAATIYNLPGEEFNQFNIPAVSEVLEKQPLPVLQSIFFAAHGSMSWLTKLYPWFFKVKKSAGKSSSWNDYLFIIAEKDNPFGKLKDLKSENIHSFLNYLKKIKK